MIHRFEPKAHGIHAVVGDADILMDAVDDGPTKRQAQGARRDGTVFGENDFIGEEDARGMVVDGAARFAIGVNRPVADNPGIEKTQALLARSVDPSVRLANEHRLTLVDGDLWQATMP